MLEQPHYSELLTEEFFIKYYIEERMSYPKIAAMLKKQGHNIAVGTLYKYAKRLGIGRSRSEAKRNRDPNPLDYEVSYMTGATIAAVDGFLLGDGHIHFDEKRKVGRLQCGLQHEEFARYLMEPFHRYGCTVEKYKDVGMKSGSRWQGQTKFHPDFYQQRQRWYPRGGQKQVPNDVRITPTSVMMWYLGDGSVVQHGNNSISLRLSTDGFSPSGVRFLVRRLRKIGPELFGKNGKVERWEWTGIDCRRNSDNRIYIDAKGIPAFFNFIGRSSPVKCYDYKFDLPAWRFEAKRMRQVADELGVEYQRLAHLVKIGKLECYRASEKGRPRFLPEHVVQAEQLVESGELY